MLRNNKHQSLTKTCWEKEINTQLVFFYLLKSLDVTIILVAFLVKFKTNLLKLEKKNY